MEKRYLKRCKLEETDIPDPIQGQVHDPEDLFVFFKDLENEAAPKIITVILDEKNLSLGNTVLGLGIKPSELDTRLLFGFASVHHALKFVIIVNHPSGDAAPTDDDRRLISQLQAQSQIMKIEFYDYVIVARDMYWSMTIQDGTACRCGHQNEIPEYEYFEKSDALGSDDTKE